MVHVKPMENVHLVKRCESSLGASDHQLLGGTHGELPHQSGMTRDRGSYLRAKYGKEERASAYMQLPPEDIRFYCMFWGGIENIEEPGHVSKVDNGYRETFENKSHLLYVVRGTRDLPELRL